MVEAWTPEWLVAKYQVTRPPQSEGALEGLDSVNWSALDHAYGEASDVPALLRAMFSHDQDERDFAFQLLHETICHQGSVYEASVYAVPFLFRMLELPQTPRRNSVALLLSSLAKGSYPLEHLASRGKEAEDEWRQIYGEGGPDLETELAKEAQWGQATREAVGIRLELLYPYLTAEESGVRGAIAKTLGLYPQRADETLPLLEKAFASESDKYAKKDMETAIARLKSGSGQTLES